MFDTATTTTATQRAFHAQHHNGRLALVLNIGLVNNPYSGLTQAQRAKEYADDIATILAGNDDFAPLGWEPVTDTVLLLQSYFPAERADNSKRNPRGAVVQWSTLVTENTDVITFDIIRHDANALFPETAISALVHRLAIGLHQEAIAVRWADEGARDISNREQGAALYGPQAAAWGAFNPAHFQPFLNASENVPSRFPAVPAVVTTETQEGAVRAA